MDTTQLATPETKIGTKVSELPENAKHAEVIAKVNELVRAFNTKRDRGPTSEREMTEADAIRVIRGDLKGMKHKQAAEACGLSYGQVYSARLGFTFKSITKETPWKVVK